MRDFLKFLIVFCFPLLASAQNLTKDLGGEHWNFRKKGDKNWLAATVPGTVHTDLFSNKMIPDPFFGANEKQLQWIESEDWEYQTTFVLSSSDLKNESAELLFEGLDTYAEVILNGKSVLKADNMFRTWKIPVKKYLKKGDNILKIVFESAVKKGKEEAGKLPYTLPGDEKIFTRKAQYQYGWDWGPRFVTAGIWKKVQLVFFDSVQLENIRYAQKSLTTYKAELDFTVGINCRKPGNYQLRINDREEVFQLKKGNNQVHVNYEIQNPKRWWCNGLGEAYLYPFQISVAKNKKNISGKNLKIGLRTIELVQEKDQKGKGFYFRLNDVPVFMKGANYIPPDSFLPRANEKVYKSLVQNAVDANMNMLRVWGGGVYADDAFYEECDANGILVWQDFMFACAMYPGDEKFLQNVKQEVIDNVNRLQNHPSIALWCGNNENDEGWHNWGWQKQYGYAAADSAKIWNDYEKLFHELIPKTLDSLISKERSIYWPSSPSKGWGRKESLLEGDSHYWGVWWGMEPFEVYKAKTGRFMSEYGFQGMPDFEVFKTFVPDNELQLNSESVKNHQKHPTGYKTIQTYMERDYKVPEKFENYIYVSQLLQAEGMKTAIEAHRRAKPYCMGTLYWQFNDCWPVTSWSSVDYSGNWKALHYQAKKSFENVLVSITEEENQLKVYVVNDSLAFRKGKFQLELMDFKGNRLWSKLQEISIDANSSDSYFTIPKSEFDQFGLKQIVFSAKLIFNNGEEKTALHYFVKPKDLKLQEPGISIKRISETSVEITAGTLAKNVFLSSKGVFFEDNYFDLLPHDKKIIKFSDSAGAIQVKSLFGIGEK